MSVWAVARRVILFGLSLIWLIAAVAKLHASGTFSLQVSALGLPAWLPIGALPYVELVLFLGTAAAGLFAWRMRLFSILNGVIYVGFVAFLAWEKLHNLGKYGCGCFGVLQHGITTGDFVRDGLLALLAFAVAFPREAKGA